MTNNKEEKCNCRKRSSYLCRDDGIYCAQCGKSISCFQPQEDKNIPKEDMDKTLKQLHAEGKSIRLEPQEEKCKCNSKHGLYRGKCAHCGLQKFSGHICSTTENKPQPQEEKPQEWEEGVIRLGRKHNLTWNQAKAIFLEWVKKEDIKKWAEEKIAYYKTRKDDATSSKEFCDAIVYILDDLLKYLDES